MILTHPFLFNCIVVLFIAFTAGWIVYVFSNRNITTPEKKIADLEKEKEEVNQNAFTGEAAPHGQHFTVKDMPVITLSSAQKAKSL